MKKRIRMFICALIMCITTMAPLFSDSVIADENRQRVVDGADLLSDSEEQSLKVKLDEISTRQKLDVVVVTVKTTDGKTPEEYADDYYDYNGYGFGTEKDGVLLLISMENRDWHITTTGYGIVAFTDAGIGYISNKMLPDLSNGKYSDAFTKYAKLCDKFITQAKKGKAYDSYNLPKDPFPKRWIFYSIIAGMIVSFIICMSMRLKLKSVGKKDTATDYEKEGSLDITKSNEQFLYNKTSRHLRSDNSRSSGSSTHSSSSGTTHGGGGGKF